MFICGSLFLTSNNHLLQFVTHRLDVCVCNAGTTTQGNPTTVIAHQSVLDRMSAPIGKPGATNAGILAAQIIGVADAGITQKLHAHKEKLAKGVEEKSRQLKESGQ